MTGSTEALGRECMEALGTWVPMIQWQRPRPIRTMSDLLAC
jgi:hypothetical protein